MMHIDMILTIRMCEVEYVRREHGYLLKGGLVGL